MVTPRQAAPLLLLTSSLDDSLSLASLKLSSDASDEHVSDAFPGGTSLDHDLAKATHKSCLRSGLHDVLRPTISSAIQSRHILLSSDERCYPQSVSIVGLSRYRYRTPFKNVLYMVLTCPGWALASVCPGQSLSSYYDHQLSLGPSSLTLPGYSFGASSVAGSSISAPIVLDRPQSQPSRTALTTNASSSVGGFGCPLLLAAGKCSICKRKMSLLPDITHIVEHIIRSGVCWIESTGQEPYVVQVSHKVYGLTDFKEHAQFISDEAPKGEKKNKWPRGNYPGAEVLRRINSRACHPLTSRLLGFQELEKDCKQWVSIFCYLKEHYAAGDQGWQSSGVPCPKYREEQVAASAKLQFTEQPNIDIASQQSALPLSPDQEMLDAYSGQSGYAWDTWTASSSAIDHQVYQESSNYRFADDGIAPEPSLRTSLTNTSYLADMPILPDSGEMMSGLPDHLLAPSDPYSHTFARPDQAVTASQAQVCEATEHALRSGNASQDAASVSPALTAITMQPSDVDIKPSFVPTNELARRSRAEILAEYDRLRTYCFATNRVAACRR